MFVCMRQETESQETESTIPGPKKNRGESDHVMFRRPVLPSTNSPPWRTESLSGKQSIRMAALMTRMVEQDGMDQTRWNNLDWTLLWNVFARPHPEN